MKKAASVFWRAQITEQDVDALIQWLENPMVTRYLNEESCAAGELCSLLRVVPEPLYGMRLSRVVANIYAENLRSMAVMRACSFVCERGDGPLHCYVLTDRMMFDALLYW